MADPQETVDEHGALRLHLGASIANNRIGRGGIVTEEDADTIIRVFKHWGWSEPHAAKPRPEMELNLAVAKYLYKWAGHFATRGTGYHEHLEDDHKAYEELQSLIAQEADKLANEARIDELKRLLHKDVCEYVLGWYKECEMQADCPAIRKRIAELATDNKEGNANETQN